MKSFLSTIFILFFSVFTFAQQWDVKYYHELEGREAVVYADNNEWSPISTKFDFELKNMSTTLPDGQVVVIPPRTKKFPITKFTPIKQGVSNGFQYSMTINFGNTLQKDYDKDFTYSLPFAKGKTYRIDQGYNGNFSHQSIDALDFNLKTSDPVHAARGGTVVEVVSHNTKSCPSMSCAKFNNKIIIMHSDFTFGDYSHLKAGGVVVKKGDEVQSGQLIGYSGDTGFTNGPHLHFSVYINRLDGSRTFIKTKFKTSAKNPELLAEKLSYTRTE